MSTLGLQLRRNLTPCKTSRDIIVFQQSRCKHQGVHRTIAVKLLEDIPGVGGKEPKASIQSVPPGRMRHVFYPRKQAAYITERSKKDNLASSSQPKMDSQPDTRNRLLSLEPLVFKRTVRNSDTVATGGAKSHQLRGSVTVHDVAQRLTKNYGINVTLLNATLTFQNSSATDRVDTTGEHHVFVHLSTGDIFPIEILVEPRLDTFESPIAPKEAII